jgi:hypothetical protein
MWAGPDLAQKGWADLGPTVLSASVGLGRTRPDPDIRAGPEPARPRKEKQGGIISPLPSSCMQNGIRSACRRR